MARAGISIQRLVPAGSGEAALVGAFSGRASRSGSDVPPVRARGVGGILDTAIDVFVSRLGFCLLASTCLWLLAESLDRLLTQRAALEPSLATLLRDIVATLAVEHVATALVVLVVYGEMQGHRVSAARALRVFLKRLPALVVYVLALSLVLVVGFLLLFEASRSPLVSVCFVLALPIVFLVAVRFAFGLAVAPAALVLERASPGDAIRRSFYLVRGSFWRWAGLRLVYTLLVVPFGAVPATLEDDRIRAGLEAWLGIGGPPAAALWLVTSALSVGIGTALSSVVMTVFYLDCRVRVEGLDLTMRLERIEERHVARSEAVA